MHLYLHLERMEHYKSDTYKCVINFEPGFTSLIISIKASHGTCAPAAYIPLPVMASYESGTRISYKLASNERQAPDAP